MTFQEPADPDAKEGLPGVHDPHAGSVSIGQPQDHCPDAVDVVVDAVVLLGSQFVDAVDINRVKRMVLIDRDRNRTTVNLARAGKNHFDIRIMMSASLQNMQLSLGVYREIGLRVFHRVDMTGLTG